MLEAVATATPTTPRELPAREFSARPAWSRRRHLLSPSSLGLGVVALSLSILLMAAMVYSRDSMTHIGNWGYLGVFLAEGGNSAAMLFPTPLPAYTLGMTGILNPVGLGIVGGAGAALGEVLGYMVGATGRDVLMKSRAYERVKRLTGRRLGPTLFVFAAVPGPFDVAGIWAGAVRYPMARFLLYVAAGKIVKVTTFAFVAYYGITWFAGPLH